ncbi:MAG: flagellar export protein FliJ [Lachnospiraceae bacterium]|nr:flagellar export protein FliJ [Lachnospiraceae bacterium]MCR4685503.1 flagellar export protein FliJ [Lachnospiraceae bacterium]
MARFRYRMQNILDVKEKLESQAKNEFAIANARLAEEEEKLFVLNERKEAYEEKLRQLYASTLEVTEINRTQDAIDNLKEQIVIQEGNVRQAMHNVDLAREKLTEAMQERKTHDKLKERQFEEFLLEEAAKESKEIDELVSFRHGQSEE